MGIMTGEVGTPMGSEGANEDGETSGPATPLPTEDDSAPAQPVKRSKALNFLKKKETKVVGFHCSPLSLFVIETEQSPSRDRTSKVLHTRL